jgi:hypothetical protein
LRNLLNRFRSVKNQVSIVGFVKKVSAVFIPGDILAFWKERRKNNEIL